MESGTGRAGRDAEELGDLGRLVPGVVAQHEKSALLGIESSEAALQLVTFRQGQEVVPAGRKIEREHAKVGHQAALAHRLMDAGSDDEAVQPRVEPIRIAEPRQVSPGDHQRFLQGILGSVDSAEDPLRDREESVTSRADQVGIRLPIPVPCRFNEIAIHGPVPCAPSGGAIRTTMG